MAGKRWAGGRRARAQRIWDEARGAKHHRRAPGRGADRFRSRRFPLSDEHSAHPQCGMSDNAIPDATSRLAGAKILVVEDETMIALLIEEMLEELGCVSWLASGTREALAILRE